MKRITVLSWNTDGLDEDETLERSSFLCDEILKLATDIVLLQEIINESITILRKKLGQAYSIRLGAPNEADTCGYFTAICIATSAGTIQSNIYTPFVTSNFGRGLQTVQIMTAHLESLGNKSGERIRQLATVFNTVSDIADDSLVVFGGDMNLRDHEVGKAGGIPPRFVDVWEAIGSSEDARWTWDLQRNDNKRMPGSPPRCRFDRLYVRAIPEVNSQKNTPILSPVSFELVGTKRVTLKKRFPSDHFGILATFTLPVNSSEN